MLDSDEMLDLKHSEDACLSAGCDAGNHSECADVMANCCECSCHIATPEPSGVIIAGCYIRRPIYDAVKSAAREVGRVQFIGVTYNPPPKPQEATPARELNFVELVSTLMAPAPFQTHLLTGAYCTYQAYTRREDVPDGCIFIAWISPQGD